MSPLPDHFIAPPVIVACYYVYIRSIPCSIDGCQVKFPECDVFPQILLQWTTSTIRSLLRLRPQQNGVLPQKPGKLAPCETKRVTTNYCVP